MSWVFLMRVGFAVTIHALRIMDSTIMVCVCALETSWCSLSSGVALCRISFSLELLKPSLLCLLRTLLHFLIPFLPANFYLPHPSTRNPFTTPTRQSDSQPETLAMRLSVHLLTIITVILFFKFAYSSHSVASDELNISIFSVVVILYTESNDILYG